MASDGCGTTLKSPPSSAPIAHRDHMTPRTPTGRAADGPPLALSEIADRLRARRLRARQPSYAEIARRIQALRTERGSPGSVAAVSRSTVYDCFRDDRKRFDMELVLDVVRALGADDDEVELWASSLESIQQRLTASSIVAVTDRLPADESAFVGRQEEIRALSSPGLASWISGMPGAGKTRLAHRVAHGLVASGAAQGVLLADLRGHSDAGPPVQGRAIVLALLRFLGHRSGPGSPEASPDLLRKLLIEQARVVVLDDAADDAQLRAVFPDPSGLSVIVTSRVIPDDAPDGLLRIPLGPLAPGESIRLLRSVAEDPRVDADPDTAAALADAAAHLPLAVELTAARIRARPEWELADHLQLASARQRVLRLDDALSHAFTLSYQALPDHARTLLRLLATHPAGALDQESIAALARDVVDDVLPALELLLRRSVLMRSGRDRYELHALLRVRLAQISWEEDPPSWRTAARLRLADSIVARGWSAHGAVVRARGDEPRQPRTPVEVSDWTPDRATSFLTGALDLILLVAHELAEEEDSPRLTAMSEAITRWLQHAGRLEEALALNREALRLASHAGDADGEGRAHVDLGTTLAYLGRHEEAAAELLAAQPFVVADAREDLTVQNALGALLDLQGDPRSAEERYHAALDRAELLGDIARQGVVWSNLGRLFGQSSRFDDSRRALERSIDLGHRAGDRLGAATGRVNLAKLLLMLRDPLAGEQEAMRALAEFEELGMTQGVIVACSNIGWSFSMRDRHEEALPWLARGLAAARSTGMRQHETEILLSLVSCRLALGDVAQAEEAAHAAMEISEETSNPHARASALVAEGDCAAARGSTARARENWTSALARFERLGAPDAEGVRARLAGTSTESL
ncbi:hypothetical protein N8K70_07705 [Microbacterium betulae]|uniref:Tetratricopeptide repeat protein n=1 Tax=Microbacterium betulae TaxID=2981139 RepID=A0AA97FK58_9MICO|nr:hypothetical protein [Microbacterium sp. AB]WOF24535.1 hypothetical protein N8K70_07705 [Microbacterium sp. AB]